MGQSGIKWVKNIYFSVLKLPAFMATFIGDYRCRADEKGRVMLPAAFKKQMPTASEDRFVIRKDIFEGCLVLYTIDDWNIQLEKIRSRINPYNREHNRFLRNFYNPGKTLFGNFHHVKIWISFGFVTGNYNVGSRIIQGKLYGFINIIGCF